jgi:tetratricopeptide (TPR) repeat protein
LTAIAAAGVFLNAVASVDFGVDSSFAVIELFRRGLFLVALLIGMAGVCLRARPEVELDDRPAPWLLYALLVGLGVFLLHNLIDFSMFEVGPLFSFAVLTGAALGMRLPLREPSANGTRGAAWALAGGGVLWLAALVALVVPVGTAEATANEGDELVRRGNVHEGAVRLERAFAGLPVNGDYAFRAAHAWRLAGDADKARALFAAAVAARPNAAGYRVARAEFELEPPRQDWARARPELEAAVRLDPNDIATRIRLGEVLAALGLRAEARKEYETALRLNDQFTREEKKRLPEARVREIQGRITSLAGG